MAENTNAKESLFSEVWRKKWFILVALALTLLYFGIMIAIQTYVFGMGLNRALIRGAAVGGFTLLGLALSIGPLAMLYPKLNFISYRRAIGVSAFFQIFLHFNLSMREYFQYNFAKLFWDLDPTRNALLFGLFAYILLFALFLTSTDWAMRKLAGGKWKMVQRLIYLAYLGAIIHFARIDIGARGGFESLGLLFLASIAMALQLAVFLRRIWGKKIGKATAIGIGTIVIYVLGLLFAFAT
ncbi:ferric reductase-like transmembrane domain-containing protein [Candidatus Micrarchaeota archaeon]|nr:ferric reductase-like transmembrane domain-containing protein [Candidatus Micrarchaeota archaeon]